MYLRLYKYGDEKNVINKSLGNYDTLTGTLKEGTSLIDPIITVNMIDPNGFNYAYVPEFSRYYFITNIKSIRNNVWEISLHVDVLKTYASEIMECGCILANTENEGMTPYLNDSIYQSLVKDKTDIISFSNGLLENGEYILITAGG